MKEFVAAYRGDDFQSFVATDGTRAFVWRTLWTDESSAQKFADEVTGASQCKAPGTSAAQHFETIRNRKIVALATDDGPLVSTLLARAAASRALPATSSVPPLGAVKLELALPKGPLFAGRAKIDVHRSGTVSGAQYTNPHIGLTAKIPAGFDSSTNEILAIDHAPPSLASGRIAFEQTGAPFNSQQDFFGAFSTRVSQALFRAAPLRRRLSGTSEPPSVRLRFASTSCRLAGRRAYG